MRVVLVNEGDNLIPYKVDRLSKNRFTIEKKYKVIAKNGFLLVEDDQGDFWKEPVTAVQHDREDSFGNKWLKESYMGTKTIADYDIMPWHKMKRS